MKHVQRINCTNIDNLLKWTYERDDDYEMCITEQVEYTLLYQNRFDGIELWVTYYCLKT